MGIHWGEAQGYKSAKSDSTEEQLINTEINHVQATRSAGHRSVEACVGGTSHRSPMIRV